MIRDAQTAVRVLELVDNANRMLKESLELVRTSCPEEEYDAYLPGIAQVTGRLFFLVIQPIYIQHPALIPADTPREFVEAWARARTIQET
jgi:hypothetical protein